MSTQDHDLTMACATPVAVDMTSASMIANAWTIGIQFCNINPERFWEITMPCGHRATYHMGALPTTDQPCTCGNPLHWFVKFDTPPEKTP